MKLHNNKVFFKEAILATSAMFNIEPAIIEKDYYVKIFLQDLPLLSRNLLAILVKSDTIYEKGIKNERIRL